MDLQKLFRWCLKAILAGIISLILLSGFCWFYSFDGVHITPESGATDYVWESNQLKATMKEGFARLHMDAQGYNNVSDFSESPDILLMGSSHMEALQVSEDENTGALLNEMLPQYKTYNIGMSGHTIYRCIDNMDNALNEYHPQEYLVMVVDTVDLSVDEMQKVVDQTAVPMPSHNRGIVYYMQKIPAVKVVYKQLADWIELEKKDSSDDYEEDEAFEFPENYEALLEEFLHRASDIAKRNNIELIIAFKPSQSLQQDGVLTYGYTEEYLQCFQQICDRESIEFINIEDSFERLYQEEEKLAHGFMNSAVGVGHLNTDGHRAVADAIVEKIQELEAE